MVISPFYVTLFKHKTCQNLFIFFVFIGLGLPSNVYICDSGEWVGMHQLDSAIDCSGEYFRGCQEHSLYWYYSAEEAGRPLLFIHSINAAPSAIELKPLFNHFKISRPVFAPDLPGFGRSERNVGEFAPSDFAREIAAMIEALPGDEAPDVIALSLGCEFVARAITEFGAKARSVTFISPTGFSDRGTPSKKAQQRLKKLFGFAGFGRNAFKLLRTERSIRHFYGMNFSGFIPNELVSYALKTTRVADAHVMPLQFLSMGLFTDNAVETLYRRLELPVLVIFDRDPNISFERFADFEDAPNWRFHRITPSLGMPHWEHPGDTTLAIQNFFAEC